MNYYIQTIMKLREDYKIHKVGCKSMPMALNRLYLGNFFNVIQAIQAAKNSGYTIVKTCSCCVDSSVRH